MGRLLRSFHAGFLQAPRWKNYFLSSPASVLKIIGEMAFFGAVSRGKKKYVHFFCVVAHFSHAGCFHVLIFEEHLPLVVKYLLCAPAVLR